MTPWLVALAVIAGAQAPQAPPQDPPDRKFDVSGQISILVDGLPRRAVTELRPVAEIDATFQPSRFIRMKFDGFLEALAADRNGLVTSGVARAREAWIELSGARGDLRAGYGRIVWGRLDEIQPSDVINPLDSARYLFDGRSAARLPVAFVRGRVFASESVVIEGVLAPVFRRGTFDELDERTSPFNLVNDAVRPAAITFSSLALIRNEPPFSLRNVSGGARVGGTIGRLDLAGAVYRGFEGFGTVGFRIDGTPAAPSAAVVGHLEQTFPRFTMIAADFETVTGQWAWRGEAAIFAEKTLARRDGRTARGQAADAGVGFDRKSGEYRVFGSLIVHREWVSEDPTATRTDVNIVGSIERAFGHDRYLARVFGVANPADASGFVRGLLIWRVRDNLSLEGSVAAFVGEGDDTLGRFKGRDFLLARVRYRF